MKIKRARFIGVRGVADATYDFTDSRTGAPHGLVFITGPSGSGKTRLLEALIAAKEAIGPLGMPPPSAPWIGAGSAAKVALTFHLNQEEVEYAGTSSSVQEAEVIFTEERARTDAEEGLHAVLGRYSHDPKQGKLEYFPSSRRLPTFPPFHGLGPAEQRIQRPGKDPRKYSFVIQFLRELENDPVRAARFGAALEALSPSCRHEPGGPTVGGPVAPLPACFSSNGNEQQTPTELSDGEADAVMFAATAVAIGLDNSLVFVDRPDLHLGDPTRVIGALAGPDRDNQLFLTTRPGVASAVGPAHVITLKAA